MYKIIFATVLGIASFLSFVLLAFAFRDFSLVLFLQFTFTLVGLCLTIYFLTNQQQEPKNLKYWSVVKDEKTGKLSHARAEDEDEPGLEGRFSITNH